MIDRLKRLLPQRIAGQIVLLVVTSLVLAHLVTILTILVLNPRPRLATGPIAAVTKLVLFAELLDAASNPEARGDILRIAQRSLPAFTLHETFPPTQRAADHPFVDDIQRSLGDRFVVFALAPVSAPPGPRQIAVQLSDGKTLVAAFPDPVPRLLGPLLISTLVFLASAIALLSLWAATALTAPLRRFADVAERFTVGGSEAPLPERGPREIVRVAKAFNDMRERVRRLVDDRARTLAAISHDLRTPITRLRLRAEEIEQEPLRRQVVCDLEGMKDLVQSALTFLRDQAKATCQATLDLPSLVQTVCDGFSDLGRNIEFVGPVHLYVRGDPDQLARAIANVIDNGLRFATTVTVRLTVGTEGVARIEIQDDGPGIPDAEKRIVLEPFYRGDLARNLNDQHGFGLGLSISRSIIETHNGTLELEDARPRGLLVRLSLPSVT